MKISNTGYTLVEELPMSSLVNYATHRRLRVFHEKGLACTVPGCPHVGTRLIIGSDKAGNLHVDVYTDDLILMTVDHHVPVSLGGSDALSNLFPMCRPHNTSKGNNHPSKQANGNTQHPRLPKYVKRWRKFVRRYGVFVLVDDHSLLTIKKIPINSLHRV